MGEKDFGVKQAIFKAGDLTCFEESFFFFLAKWGLRMFSTRIVKRSCSCHLIIDVNIGFLLPFLFHAQQP